MPQCGALISVFQSFAACVCSRNARELARQHATWQLQISQFTAAAAKRAAEPLHAHLTCILPAGQPRPRQPSARCSPVSLNSTPQGGRCFEQCSGPTACTPSAGRRGESAHSRPPLRFLSAHGNGGGSTTLKSGIWSRNDGIEAASERNVTASRRESAAKGPESVWTPTALQEYDGAEALNPDMPAETEYSGGSIETRQQRIMRRVQEAECRRRTAKQQAMVRTPAAAHIVVCSESHPNDHRRCRSGLMMPGTVERHLRLSAP